VLAKPKKFGETVTNRLFSGKQEDVQAEIQYYSEWGDHRDRYIE
jgi:hypothetical protein